MHPRPAVGAFHAWHQKLQVPPRLRTSIGDTLSGLLASPRREKLPHELHKRRGLLQCSDLVYQALVGTTSPSISDPGFERDVVGGDKSQYDPTGSA